MTAPPYGHLQIRDEMLDDLLSAMRRHHRNDCQRLLAVWAEDEHVVEPECEGHDWDHVPCLDDAITAWVHAEVSLHVDGGRFEHALCLVEAYRPPLTEEAMRRRLYFPPEALL